MRTLISFRDFGTVNYVLAPEVYDWEPPVRAPSPQTGPPIVPPDLPDWDIDLPPAPVTTGTEEDEED
ncbi:MAG: hypothetical protein ACM3ME_04760 [Chloroflexota bacterium]|nr:hypothetical protein [Lentimicrobium sp.]